MRVDGVEVNRLERVKDVKIVGDLLYRCPNCGMSSGRSFATYCCAVSKQLLRVYGPTVGPD
jgi:hypothetical protein